MIKPNRTGKQNQTDKVYTPIESAISIIKHFSPNGSILEPCAWKNAFYDNLPWEKYRCEIDDWLDFFKWDKPVDWIITNPPYSIYDDFLIHAMEVANNIVFFVPLQKAFKSAKIFNLMDSYGWLKEVLYMWTWSKHWFPFWFTVWCLYFQKWYKWQCTINYK